MVYLSLYFSRDAKACKSATLRWARKSRPKWPVHNSTLAEGSLFEPKKMKPLDIEQKFTCDLLHSAIRIKVFASYQFSSWMLQQKLSRRIGSGITTNSYFFRKLLIRMRRQPNDWSSACERMIDLSPRTDFEKKIAPRLGELSAKVWIAQHFKNKTTSLEIRRYV